MYSTIVSLSIKCFELYLVISKKWLKMANWHFFGLDFDTS